jgi:hypothetical protein
MVVFSNHRLGASAELVVSRMVAKAMLAATASAAAPLAEGRWERELVNWLAEHAIDPTGFDVGDIAWTPDHFEAQRSFLVGAIVRAAEGSEHEAALRRWVQLIEAHPRESVRFGRRWSWQRSITI